MTSRRGQPTTPPPAHWRLFVGTGNAGQANTLPSVDDWYGAAQRLAGLVRQAFTETGSVARKDLLRALEEWERIDKASQAT